MATTITNISPAEQSMAEIRQWDVDFSNDCPTGVTVSSATATHIPPAGASAVTPSVGSISANVVPVTISTLAGVGVHWLVVVATLSNTNKSEVRIRIPVNY